MKLCACTNINVEKIQQTYSDEIRLLGKKEFLKVIRWKLSKYVGREWSGMDGRTIMPKENLTTHLTKNYILNELNEHNCFDFDYKPKEGDNLILEIGWLFNKRGKKINRESNYAYSSYIYKNGKWITENYNSFYEKTEIINEGILKNVTQ